MLKLLFIPAIIICFAACGGNKENNAPAPPAGNDTPAAWQQLDTAGKSTGADPVSKVNLNNPGNGLAQAANIEMVPFCVLVPDKDYVAGEHADGVKGKLFFTHKSRKDDEIVVQGLMRSDTTVSLQDYYADSYSGAEEEGKIIEKKELLPQKSCFYFWGYYNNLIYNSRFIEIVWLRKDEAVTYTATFNIADTAVWKNRLKGILDHGSDCK